LSCEEKKMGCRRVDCREQAAKVSRREKEKISSIEKNKMFSHWLQMH